MNGTPYLNGRSSARTNRGRVPAATSWEPPNGMSAADRGAVTHWLRRGLTPGEIAPLLPGVTERRITRWLLDLVDFDRGLSRLMR